MEYRGYRIEGDGVFGMKLIKFPGQGGQISNYLKGMFTNFNEAKKAIDYYKDMVEERENKPEPIKKVKLTPREV